ncbi:hypothetical protein GIB67_041449 [Kingdonia uniflora]|uniref:Uncharacterized protein n=1 Tax=Kingdonia uniflora TaxID=39325 RepID=A0A7J7LRW3_9MAGN|nr:hypothetical protein GIB67_041449 [Kingdonia uniflora]
MGVAFRRGLFLEGIDLVSEVLDLPGGAIESLFTPTDELFLGFDSSRAADPEEVEEISVIRDMETALHISLEKVLILTDCRHLCVLLQEHMVRHQCCDNPPTLSSTSGVVKVEEFGGLNTYITGFPDFKLAIILISNVFGKYPFP